VQRFVDAFNGELELAEVHADAVRRREIEISLHRFGRRVRGKKMGASMVSFLAYDDMRPRRAERASAKG
jgi:hypothetical protein